MNGDEFFNMSQVDMMSCLKEESPLIVLEFLTKHQTEKDLWIVSQADVMIMDVDETVCNKENSDFSNISQSFNSVESDNSLNMSTASQEGDIVISVWMIEKIKYYFVKLTDY